MAEHKVIVPREYLEQLEEFYEENAEEYANNNNIEGHVRNVIGFPSGGERCLFLKANDITLIEYDRIIVRAEDNTDIKMFVLQSYRSDG